MNGALTGSLTCAVQKPLAGQKAGCCSLVACLAFRSPIYFNIQYVDLVVGASGAQVCVLPSGGGFPGGLIFWHHWARASFHHILE